MRRTNDNWTDQLKNGGPAQSEALAALRESLFPALRKSFGGRSGADEAFFEDVVQETLVKTMDPLDQFQGRSRFTTWATSIAVRVALTALRRSHWKDVSLDQVLQDSEGPADRTVDSPELPAHQKVIVDKMYEVIHDTLTQRQRDSLLAELKGMPQEEIGRHMGINRNAVYKLTHDARKRLKSGLEAVGYGAEDIQMAFDG